jgi:eukaryotic-like serine/threonine-protein kinase
MSITLPSRYNFTGATTDGGMGDIHECTDTHLNRRVVLKLLKDGEDNRRLLDELKALIQLRSKHVVQLFDVITVQDGSLTKKALVLEFIEGTDLGFGEMEPGTRYLSTLWQVACGLVDIHKAGVIHRDIKPNNVRVGKDGVVKILDFGLARNTGLEAKTMSVIGTPGFMAPELWQTSAISFEQAIDVYAFAVMAMVLITPEIPAELLERPPKPLPAGTLARFFNNVPADVVTVLERCLANNPANRPQIADVEAIIRRYLLYNRHRALLVLGGKTHEINSTTPTVNVKSGEIGNIGITYDGLKFTVSSISGSVSVNHRDISVGDELPGCCVIAFGQTNRSFVTFDVSNPEVMP